MKQTTITLLLLCSLAYGQERFISIDQQKFRIKDIGSGNITVIFENGMSDSLEIWGSIPDSIAKNSKVFLYDRAGIGKSDTSRLERTIPNMVLELRSILQNEKIRPPYVLVGHSMGGLITRYFAGTYPAEVKGLLLLDPVAESYWNNMSKKELKKYIEGGNEWYRTKFPENYRKEWYQFIPNLAYMNNLFIDQNLPVILVSATAWKWYNYHKDIIAPFDNGKHFELEGEHHIFKNHPGLIIQYVNQLLNQ